MHDYTTHQAHFTEDGLIRKLRDLPLGGEVAKRALRLLELFRDERVPAWAKAVIAGAIGYLDDAAVLAAALSTADDDGHGLDG